LLFEPAHTSGELVPDELLRSRQDLGPRLAHGQSRDSLELGELPILRLFELVLELLDVRLPIGDSLLAAFEFELTPVDVVLPRVQPLAFPEGVGALALQLVLDLGAMADRRLLGLQISLATQRLGLV